MFTVYDKDGFLVKSYTTEKKAWVETAALQFNVYYRKRRAEEFLRQHGFIVVEEPDDLELETNEKVCEYCGLPLNR